MKFAIAQYTNLSQERNNWITDLSVELKSFFENRNYGDDLKELYFGLITVKPEFDQFFKKKKPQYRPGERTTTVDSREIKTNNCVEIDCKLDFTQVSDLDKGELISKVCEEILRESDSLTRILKLKEFDFQAYKSDLQSYFWDKKYIQKKIL